MTLSLAFPPVDSVHEAVPGLRLYPNCLDLPVRRALLAAVRDVVRCAPLYRPEMPRNGKPFSVRMTNAGRFGWVSDRDGGYRYQRQHPLNGRPWPAIPYLLIDLWRRLCRYGHDPEACLVNWYAPGARMGLHQDRDEDARDAPVLSVSLGDTALFRIGGPNRGDATRSFSLCSGDVLVLDGPARHAYHGVDRIYPGTDDLLPWPGRINLTLRRVRLPAADDSS